MAGHTARSPRRSKRRLAASRELYEAAQEYCRQYEVLDHEGSEVHFTTLVSGTARVQDKAERALEYIGDYEADQSRRTGGYDYDRPKAAGMTLADLVGGGGRDGRSPSLSR